MEIYELDHLVMPVRSIDATIDFYSTVMGMKPVEVSGNRRGLRFGDHRISLYELGNERDQKAKTPMPGSHDLCFLTSTPVNEIVEYLRGNDIEIVEGPVARTGCNGPILSVYFRDPDGNLIEVGVPKK